MLKVVVLLTVGEAACSMYTGSGLGVVNLRGEQRGETLWFSVRDPSWLVIQQRHRALGTL